MKADLIADWRARVADRTLITLPVTAIERILDERDKLLASARSLLAVFLIGDAVDGEEPRGAYECLSCGGVEAFSASGPHLPVVHAPDCALSAAIAYAEAE